MTRAPVLLARLRRDKSGVAAIEFALTAPVVLSMFLVGAEVMNSAIVQTRVDQLAMHVADNASRIGQDSALSLKQISEMQINDLLTGANLQMGKLDLLHRGRVVVSSLEPIATPTNPTGKFKIRWQRCYGEKAFSSAYGVQGTTDLTAVGPPNQQVTAVPDGGATIYVEVAYNYRPLISGKLIPSTATVRKSVASMVVRDDRDFVGPTGSTTGIYNTENVPVSTC